jgi:excisionase family DNA binding protein
LIPRLADMAQGASTRTPLPELLTVVELAAYLDRPVSTIHYWRGKGEGPPALKLGKQLRFRAADVVQWLEERRREGGDAD